MAFDVFISGVSSEFGNLRKQIRTSLGTRHIHADLQDHIRPARGQRTLLDTLHERVRDCRSGTICLIGRRSGSFPLKGEVTPQYRAMLPKGIRTASYTQWEAIFALHYQHTDHRNMAFAFADAAYPSPPMTKQQQAEDNPKSQEQFSQYIKKQAPLWKPFSDDNNLLIWLLEQQWQPTPPQPGPPPLTTGLSLLQLFVPTQGRGADNGITAVASPVTPDLILTARDILTPANRDPKRPIRARWVDYPDAGPHDGWFALPDDATVWTGTKTLDAVLLKCPRPAGLAGFGLLSGRPPREGAEWTTSGITAVAGVPASCRGAVKQMAFSLDPATPPGSGSGIVGAPIVYANTNLIIGIARTDQSAMGGGVLSVLPTAELLADRDFRDAAGLPDPESRLKAFQIKLADALASSPIALKAAASNRVGVGTRSAESVAAELTALTHTEALLRLRRAFDTVGMSPGGRDQDAITAIRQAMEIVAPCLCDPGLVAGVRSQIDHPNILLVDLPVVMPTVAEMVMAGVEGRKMSLRPRDDPRAFHIPTHLIHPEPPSGMAGGVDAKTRDHAEYITTKHSARPWQETRYRLENVLIDRMLAPSDRSKAAGDRQHEDNVKFATALLNASTKDHRYYMLCQLPADPADRREMEEGLRQLSGRFPALVILAVMDDMATKLNEITEHEPLRYVLP